MPEFDDKRIKEAVDRFLEEKKEIKSYFKSQDFNKRINIIKEHDSIFQQDLLYGAQEIDGLNHDQFRKVCHSVFYSLDSKVEYIKNKLEFISEYRVNYSGIEFTLFIGQGSEFITRKLK